MLSSISSISTWATQSSTFPSAMLNFLSSEQTKRIKSLVIGIFSKITHFFKNFTSPPNEGNSKTIAMISCLSILVIVAISILGTRSTQDTQLNIPETPAPDSRV